MKVYLTRNLELGYVNYCRPFTDRQKAEDDAAYKCRNHDVIEVDSSDLEPCTPIRDGFKRTEAQVKYCETCVRFAGWIYKSSNTISKQSH